MSGRKAKGKAAPSPSAAASPPAATKETVEAGQSGRKGVTAAAEAASSKETERVHDHAAEDSDGGDRGYGYEHTDDEDEDDSPGAAAAREARYPMMTESEAREALARQQRLEAQLQATMAQMAALERLAVQAGRADLLTGPGLRRRGAASRDADDAGEDEGDEDEADEDGHDDAESGADEDDDGEDGAPAAGTLAATAGARPSRAARDAGSVRRSDKFVVDPKSTYMPPHVVARGAPPPADDCMLLCAGLFGFVLLFAFGAVMVSVCARWLMPAVPMPTEVMSVSSMLQENTSSGGLYHRFVARRATAAASHSCWPRRAYRRTCAQLIRPSVQLLCHAVVSSLSIPLYTSLYLSIRPPHLAAAPSPSVCLSVPLSCSPSSGCRTTCSWRAPWQLSCCSSCCSTSARATAAPPAAATGRGGSTCPRSTPSPLSSCSSLLAALGVCSVASWAGRRATLRGPRSSEALHCVAQRLPWRGRGHGGRRFFSFCCTCHVASFHLCLICVDRQQWCGPLLQQLQLQLNQYPFHTPHVPVCVSCRAPLPRCRTRASVQSSRFSSELRGHLSYQMLRVQAAVVGRR